MIDLRLLRSEHEMVRAALARRGIDLAELEQVMALDEQHCSFISQRDEMRHQVRELSQQVGQLKRAGCHDEADALAAQSREQGERERALTAQTDVLGEKVRELLLRIPNLPSCDAPDGADESDNLVLRMHGVDVEAYAPHQRVPHWEFAVEAGWLDMERAAKLSGSMFAMFRGSGAALARALVQYGLDRNADCYEEIRPPSLVHTEVMVSTGQLPKFAEDAYCLERDNLWAIPTAEVPLTSLASGEILDEADLPVRMMAHTSCYRREAGAAGRDTRGLLRVHEFDKVEILAYATSEQAPIVHEEILERAELAVADLGLGYRVVDICAGDLGQAHHRSWDVEVYAPGAAQWLEVSSVSWYSDYQARRANLRYRVAGKNGTRYLHTLNGSALAVPRMWAALVETYRQPDGTVALPEVLQPYLGRSVL
ncbi:MAG: serine--tRNA ligase [Acidimicrobiia bacterium]|nr:serine--tRNA ligase [Acidimicrobiia bacterium]MYC57663.1 serine--tRNA ligase [Acidimicrobiia bacterium]MYI31215.1 serine--tRNA ligase [Acidimicrobiia bacterium]